MKGSELRRLFLDYFVERGHRLIPSAPLIPPDDPSLLFTNAGMVQFKRLYAGEVEPLPYTRACSVQKCLRAGGKGSDLENVGRTLRHHTFFEMLGNFSFGDYFKREAIAWGWDFVTNVMQLPVERLFVSIYEEDAEAADIWEREQGILRSRIIPLDAKENFWGPAGDTGACGPCSEIIFFMGTETELAQAQRQDTSTLTRRLSKEGDLFFEIWNMVFPQFNQRRDGSRTPLKYRGIDTGAGLERMLTAQNFVETGGKIGSPYETDLLWKIVEVASSLTGLKYVRRFESLGGRDAEQSARFRLGLNAIADHTRALVFALSEGIMPSNEGRGYVLRRILRRALRLAYLLGKNEPFMCYLANAVIDLMGETWHELKKHPDHVSKVIRNEEENFLRTLAQGEVILSKLIVQTKAEGKNIISGADVFKLHATYGYPVDLTAEVAADAGLEIDRAGYEAAMRGHREEAKKSWKGAALEHEADLLSDIFDKEGATNFAREDENKGPVFKCKTCILAILKDGARVDAAYEEDAITIVLNTTCFYGESGGQAGDKGAIHLDEKGRSGIFEVEYTLKTPSGIHLHKGRMNSGEMRVEDAVWCMIDKGQRLAIMRNHTATHLLQAALRENVGKHIAQQGSSVTQEGFRFDFTNPEPLTPEQIKFIELRVQEFIRDDILVETKEMPIEEARRLDAIAPFGEKYGEMVRVVTIGDVSMEFCGGTHCRRTSEVGFFLILSESSIASGVRRIEAKTGMGAYLVNVETREMLTARVEKLLAETKEMKKEIKRLRQEKASGSVDDVLATARETGGIRFVTHQTEGLDSNEMRNLADELRARLKEGVVVIGNTDGEKVSLVCAVTAGVKKKAPAGKIISEVAKIVGGKGGGRDDMAQAGGRFPEKLPEALAAVENILKSILPQSKSP